MKAVNSFAEQPVYEDLAGKVPSMAAAEVGQIIDKATQNGVSSHQEVLQLAKLIRKLDPREVDAGMQAKFDQLMGKVRAQFA